MLRPPVLALAFAFGASNVAALLAAAAAAGGERCRTESFTIEARPVAVQFCALPAITSGPVAVDERVSSGSAPPIARSLHLDLVDGERAARALDDVPLAPLGIARTLHLELIYDRSGAHLEHALLVPGAIRLK